MDTKFVQERITQLRLAKNISEYQLSTELGHCKSYIQGISSGQNLPSLKALFDICDYFQITLQEFFDDAAPDSELVQKLLQEVRCLPPEEQYALYQFLLARNKSLKQ